MGSSSLTWRIVVAPITDLPTLPLTSPIPLHAVTWVDRPGCHCLPETLQPSKALNKWHLPSFMASSYTFPHPLPQFVWARHAFSSLPRRPLGPLSSLTPGVGGTGLSLPAGFHSLGPAHWRSRLPANSPLGPRLEQEPPLDVQMSPRSLLSCILHFHSTYSCRTSLKLHEDRDRVWPAHRYGNSSA